MAFAIKMPQLGLTMEEGTVAQWIKQEGDTVKTGDVLLEITTDKLTSEIESEADGVLLKIVAKEGEDVPVQGILGYIGEAGEKIADGAAPAQEAGPAPETATTPKPVPTDSVVQVQAATGGRVRISPLAKKTAQKLGVAYQNLKGSGPAGRIVQKDVLAAAEAQKQEPVPVVETAPKPVAAKVEHLELMDGDEVVKLAGMRKVVAERMAKSAREIPTVTQNVKIDVTALMAFRKQVNESSDQKFSVNDFVLKAVAKALKANKHILVSIDGDQIIKRAHVNLGMAVALDDGLIVPVIRDADKLTLSELAETARDLASRARENKLTMEEYKGSTFTISNLGMFGVETFDPIINQPDAGILGVCAIQDELAMDEDGKIFKKQVMRISFTFDHRLIDGAVAAKFELAVKALLEDPMQILL